MLTWSLTVGSDAATLGPGELESRLETDVLAGKGTNDGFMSCSSPCFSLCATACDPCSEEGSLKTVLILLEELSLAGNAMQAGSTESRVSLPLEMSLMLLCGSVGGRRTGEASDLSVHWA